MEAGEPKQTDTSAAAITRPKKGRIGCSQICGTEVTYCKTKALTSGRRSPSTCRDTVRFADGARLSSRKSPRRRAILRTGPWIENRLAIVVGLASNSGSPQLAAGNPTERLE
jgi:hypothetical protein